MKKYDLLDDLIHGKITPDEADDICSGVLADTTLNIPAHEALGLTKVEWTAYAHGADFQEVADWRQHGWPDRCFVCGGRIKPESFGWLAREHNGKTQLKHVTCPKDGDHTET
ncbi:hypothetical protein ACIP1U_32380 [Cupriavidus sp. NPDC089707]|uniref:hypothetical protein n=1 Tax=Cupriavidus sp. NPDC089707 TaxID=3363963 RepID=UPI003803D81B